MSKFNNDDPLHWTILPDDIAVFKLATPVKLGDDNKGVACVASSSDREELATKSCYIYGYGYGNGKNITELMANRATYLQEMKVPVKTNAVCNEETAFNKTIQMTFYVPDLRKQEEDRALEIAEEVLFARKRHLIAM